MTSTYNMILYAAKRQEDNDKSKNEHAKDVASAIAAGANIPAYSIGKHTCVHETNLLIIGCEVSNGKPPRTFTKMLNELTPQDVKLVVVFSVLKSGTESALAVAKSILEPKGVNLHDEEFVCNGASMFSNRGCPTDEDFKRARAFGSSMMAKFRKM